MATICNLQVFDSVFVLTNGGRSTRPDDRLVHLQGLFQFDNVGYGATLSCLLLLVILALTVVELRLLRGRRTS